MAGSRDRNDVIENSSESLLLFSLHLQCQWKELHELKDKVSFKAVSHWSKMGHVTILYPITMVGRKIH